MRSSLLSVLLLLTHPGVAGFHLLVRQSRILQRGELLMAGLIVGAAPEQDVQL